jgi:hypothetical protein
MFATQERLTMPSNRMLALAALLLALGVPAAAQTWGRPSAPGQGACFYRNINFGGDYFCMRAGDRYPSLPRGFNDQISSIRVFGGAQARIFNDVNFRGSSSVTPRNVNDLRRWQVPGSNRNWNDRISAIAVFGRGGDQWLRPTPR